MQFLKPFGQDAQTLHRHNLPKAQACYDKNCYRPHLSQCGLDCAVFYVPANKA